MFALFGIAGVHLLTLKHYYESPYVLVFFD